ncbi:MAG: hypothetical protein E7504_00090 [Ruminococcus sp.]|nr:hypothetical protein [Ruminococcus sp.]
MYESSSLPKGILGAVIGSIPGIALWVLLGYFGYTAAIVGAVVALGILFGYDKLGGTLDKQGLIACIVVMLLAIYAGVHLTWAVVVNQVLQDLVISITQLHTILLATDLEFEFLKDLGLGYLFSLLGAASLIAKAFR